MAAGLRRKHAAAGVEIGETPLLMGLDRRAFALLVPGLDQHQPPAARQRIPIGEHARPPEHLLKEVRITARPDQRIDSMPGARIPPGLGYRCIVDDPLGRNAVPDLGGPRETMRGPRAAHGFHAVTGWPCSPR